MKLPGQRRGEVVDRFAETVDILPTILDVLGAKASLRLDGRSLIDSRIPERSPRTFFLRDRFNRAPRALGDLSADRAASLIVLVSLGYWLVRVNARQKRAAAQSSLWAASSPKSSTAAPY